MREDLLRLTEAEPSVSPPTPYPNGRMRQSKGLLRKTIPQNRQRSAQTIAFGRSYLRLQRTRRWTRLRLQSPTKHRHFRPTNRQGLRQPRQRRAWRASSAHAGRSGPGLALALGGVFLVRYSIESGLLGPGVRLSLAALFGLLLMAAGELVRRKALPQTTALYANAMVPGILTAAGAVALFGAIYAAHGIYEFIGPGKCLRPSGAHRLRRAGAVAPARSGFGRPRPRRIHGDTAAGVVNKPQPVDPVHFSNGRTGRDCHRLTDARLADRAGARTGGAWPLGADRSLRTR